MSIRGQGHFLTFDQGCSDFKNPSLSFSETTGPADAKFHMKARQEQGIENLFT